MRRGQLAKNPALMALSDLSLAGERKTLCRFWMASLTCVV